MEYVFEDEETTPSEAQYLVWDAWEAPGKKEALALAKRALSIDPNLADAYNVLGFHEKNLAKKLEYHKRAYDMFKESHGKAFFEKYTGLFWSELETRPFMRAAFSYADCLWKSGERVGAVFIYQEMLRLCPNDNMGVRFILNSWVIMRGDFAGARKLIKQYECCTANLSYGKLLLDIIEHRAASTVKKSFAKAFADNPFIPGYILGVYALPKKAPEMYGLGDAAEAVVYMLTEYGKELWETHPDAISVLSGFVASVELPRPETRLRK